MKTKALVSEIEKVLCCPTGVCRAIKSGDPKQCGAFQTRQHAEAAARVFSGERETFVAALTKIRARIISEIDADGISPHTEILREIAKIASDALN